MCVDGVVGKRVCLTGLILGQTEGPQFEPELMHMADKKIKSPLELGCHHT